MKTETILLIYDTLLSGHTVERKSFCRDHGISERTFYRYMREISLYLMAHHADCVVDVREPDGVYYVKK